MGIFVRINVVSVELYYLFSDGRLGTNSENGGIGKNVRGVQHFGARIVQIRKISRNMTQKKKRLRIGRG